jgi:signal transduction histidine kinase
VVSPAKGRVTVGSLALKRLEGSEGADSNESHRAIVDAAHEAGKAEIATSILHNVGNVLNSVNVSLSTMAEIVSRSRVPLLEKTAALLNANLKDVATFLTEDPKGQQIPEFLVAVSGNLKAERESLEREIELLKKNIEHIKVIISVQQSHAKASRFTDQVNLDDLVRDALAVNAVGLEEARVRLVREGDEMPVITIEKHKVLQILVNLISNALHALRVTAGRQRVLTLATRLVGKTVEISVGDNGVGVPKENLQRIFQHGFTTRSDGHGFGLHGSAIAATQMQGSLTVTSEGNGRGAVFTLRLPLEAAGAGTKGRDDVRDA